MLTSRRFNQLIGAYGNWVRRDIENGYEAYLLSFMFLRITGTHEEIHGAMLEAVTGCYAKLLTRVFRYPNSRENRANPMKWLVVPDRPVPKHARKSLREVSLNGGLHMHAIALVPPFTRLKRPLGAQIAYSQEQLAIALLIRVHAVNIDRKPEYVTDYAFKSLKRDPAAYDDILILPRTRNQVAKRET